MRHGTCAMYSHGGCRCDDCRRAMREDRRRYRKDPRTVPADDACLYLRRLVKRGYSIKSIGLATGIYNGTLWKLWHGDTKRITKRVEDAVFQFSPETIPKRRCCVPAGPVARMVRVMRRNGIERPEIARAIGMHPNTISALLGQRQVMYETARKVSVLYELLAREGLVPASALEDIA